MEVVSGSVSLVILGAWNPALLNPDWITRELFEVPEGQDVNVALEVPIGSLLSSPKITYDGFVFLANIDKLTITVLDPTEASINRAENMARLVLQKLSYTPVSAFGQNIMFLDKEPTTEQISVFSKIPSQPPKVTEGTTIGTSLRWALERNGGITNITHELSNGQLAVKFNFHYGVVGASDAANKLSGTFFSNIDMARKATIIE